MKALVLGGTGFIGRHTVAALLARGHSVVVGTRRPNRAERRLPRAAFACERREARFEWLTDAGSWEALLSGVQVVVNAVGILRERGAETYERIHHLAPAALAVACHSARLRLIHVSALGLHADARSRFITSKLRGERAIAASGVDYSIVRPSLLDGDGGFGARWLRRAARWPVSFVPGDARGRIAAMDVRDLGTAIGALCETRSNDHWREVELGGGVARTIDEYLAALRRAGGGGRAMRVTVPAWLARTASHVCDALHFSPFSFGHLELMQRDNVPSRNRLFELLGRAPTPVGVEVAGEAGAAREPAPALQPRA